MSSWGISTREYLEGFVSIECVKTAESPLGQGIKLTFFSKATWLLKKKLVACKNRAQGVTYNAKSYLNPKYGNIFSSTDFLETVIFKREI